MQGLVEISGDVGAGFERLIKEALVLKGVWRFEKLAGCNTGIDENHLFPLLKTRK
jgi:hypothetical protein